MGNRWMLAGAGVVLVVGAGLAGHGLSANASWFTLPDRLTTKATRAPARSAPTTIRIASINVRAKVDSVGLDSDGMVDAPPLHRTDVTGWYSRGPAPGERGPAIIVGHVDSKTGPSVFHRLGQVKPGHLVEVTRRDRAVAVFRVEAVRQYSKAGFPAREVYGDYRTAALRLITCGGRWDSRRGEYTDNIVVFATLSTPPRPPGAS